MQHVCVCVFVLDDGDYQTLSSSCLRKRAAVRQLKLQLQQLQVQRTASHQRIDARVQQLVVSSFIFLFLFADTKHHIRLIRKNNSLASWGGLVAEWLTCWTQVQITSNRSRDAVG